MSAPPRRACWEALLDAAVTPLDLAHELLDLMVDRQAMDVVLLDLTQLSAFADYFVIGTVDNVRQARAVTPLVNSTSERLPAASSSSARWLEGRSAVT